MNLYVKDHPVTSLNDHNCFGCGVLNPAGLHLQFYRLADESGIWAPFTPTRAYEGYGGIIHGGIVCTLLDEIMAWSLYARSAWAVTARMQTSFRKPVQVGEDVILTGRIVRDRGRLFEVRGEVLRASDHVLLAQAEGTFMRVPESQAAEWNERYLTQGAYE